MHEEEIDEHVCIIISSTRYLYALYYDEAFVIARKSDERDNDTFLLTTENKLGAFVGTIWFVLCTLFHCFLDQVQGFEMRGFIFLVKLCYVTSSTQGQYKNVVRTLWFSLSPWHRYFLNYTWNTRPSLVYLQFWDDKQPAWKH